MIQEDATDDSNVAQRRTASEFFSSLLEHFSLSSGVKIGGSRRPCTTSANGMDRLLP